MIWFVIAAVPLVFLAAVWILLLTPPRPLLRIVAKHNPDTLFFVDTNERAIALTIDDSPHRDVTPGILDVLARHDARATFFVIGSNANKHPELVEAIRAEGHASRTVSMQAMTLGKFRVAAVIPTTSNPSVDANNFRRDTSIPSTVMSSNSTSWSECRFRYAAR